MYSENKGVNVGNSYKECHRLFINSRFMHIDIPNQPVLNSLSVKLLLNDQNILKFSKLVVPFSSCMQEKEEIQWMKQLHLSKTKIRVNRGFRAIIGTLLPSLYSVTYIFQVKKRRHREPIAIDIQQVQHRNPEISCISSQQHCTNLIFSDFMFKTYGCTLLALFLIQFRDIRIVLRVFSESCHKESDTTERLN